MSDKLVGPEKTKQLFESVSLKDSYGLLLSQFSQMEDELLRRLRTCKVEELIEVQAEAKVLYRMRERIVALKAKEEKQSPRVMPAGM